MVKMRVSGTEEPGLHLPPLPDDSGEELSRVHVEDGKSSRQGKLPHQSQHNEHHRQIWWRLPVSHMESGQTRPLGPDPALPNSSPCVHPSPREPLTPEKETRGLSSTGYGGRGPGICWDEDDGDTHEATQNQNPRLTLPAAHPFHYKDAAVAGRRLDCSKD